MVALHLISLFVAVFGAFAYGSAALLWLRQASPVWAPYQNYARVDRSQTNLVSFALFVLSTLWFILNGLSEYRQLAGAGERGWFELGILALVFAYPPLIMHVVYVESVCDGDVPPGRVARALLAAMYVASPLTALWAFAIVADLIPAPANANFAINAAIGALFTVTSIYGTTVMLRGKTGPRTANQLNLRNGMVGLFVVLSILLLVPVFLGDRSFAVSVLDRVLRASPLAFLLVSVYFENRFEFYDMVVKRGVMLLLTIVLMGAVFMVVMPWMDRLPDGVARPWIAAAALVPVVMMMPWIYWRLARWMDRIWFRREFTPVEAVKHILGAMQPATDERSLVQATEERLTEIFNTPIEIVLDPLAQIDPETIEAEIVSASPVSGTPVRMTVLGRHSGRPLLSEDLTLLRSLGGVFGFMLENVRLQHRRLEQEQIAQALRLQTSRSELKALRAQINPHFLFNALNAIASLIHTDPARADAAVEQLAEVFRYTLRRSDSEWAPLDQELAFAQAYLDVEQARFGRRLTFSIYTDRAAVGAQVPSMLLQTLVENAVKHGISRLRGPGHVAVGARVIDGRLSLEVRDTGPGLDPEPSRARRPEGESFGLRSVRDRLTGHFGERASLTLERDAIAGLTIARIEMPLAEVRA